MTEPWVEMKPAIRFHLAPCGPLVVRRWKSGVVMRCSSSSVRSTGRLVKSTGKMARAVRLAFGLILCGLIAGCQSGALPLPGNRPSLSRIDAAPIPSRDALTDLTTAAFRAFRKNTDLQLTAPISDDARRLVIVSWTNGAGPAASAPGLGRGVTEATQNAIQALRPDTKAELTWGVSIDVVEAIDPIADVKALRLDRLADGLIFEHRNQLLLSGQLRARALISPSGRYTPPALDRVLSRPSHRFVTTTCASNGFGVVFRKHGRPLLIDDDLSDERLTAAIGHSERYLRSIVDEDGKFLYQLDVATGRLDSDYNLARHAGTIHALIDLYRQSKSSESLMALDKAITFLLTHYRKIEFEIPQFMGGVDPMVIADGGQIRLAAVALSLLALTHFADVASDPAHLESAKTLGAFIRHLQKSDGRYEPHNSTLARGVDLGSKSPYAPGEADFALCRLHDVTADPVWLDTAEANIRYLIETRDALIDQQPHDHWMLYALDRLDDKRPHRRNVTKAKLLVASILAAQDLRPESGAEMGAWRSNNVARLTPAATRAEGLLAAARLFKRRGETEWASKAAEGAKQTVAYLLRAQIIPETSHHLRVPHSFVGGFPASLDRDEVRIDFVQHAIAAILAYREWRQSN